MIGSWRPSTSDIKLFVNKLSLVHHWKVVVLPPAMFVLYQMELPWVAEQPPGVRCS